ncbi:MAG: DUF1634 domain-containing protein [Deltaproteobacteria bacterium]|nr:DUF1634 domain-containing protein [Deltaproteobacteria bacterium]
MALVLRTGVAASSTLILIGLAITFLRHPEYRTSTDALAALLAPGASRAPFALLGGLSSLRGQGFVLAGIILLVATPIVRVATTSAILARQGARRLALFGLGSLLLLIVSALVSGPAH